MLATPAPLTHSLLNTRLNVGKLRRSRTKSIEVVLALLDDGLRLGGDDGLGDLGGRLLHELLVEVGEVVLHFGLVRRVVLLGEQLFLVQRGKPGVGEDLVDAVLAEARSFVLIQQLEDKVLSRARHGDFVALRIGEVNLRLLNEVVHLMLVTVEERRNTD